MYDVFIVTGSVDSTDLYGVTDFAIGHFTAGEDIQKGSSEAMKGEWLHLASTYGQDRWEYVFGLGLIDTDEAEELADEVWKEDIEEDEEDMLDTAATAAVKLSGDDSAGEKYTSSSHLSYL